ncbi:hypothetical protein KTU01_29350 [Kocuria turfanensis]|uniref:Uncharacterized protein n=1 Tax=Kocuria turfanensis TaxID=388357 RepID=A0A512IGH9_9MICC|nr:hypothetical protein KTU01_29350 [Kocuria turfanensis]
MTFAPAASAPMVMAPAPKRRTATSPLPCSWTCRAGRDAAGAVAHAAAAPPPAVMSRRLIAGAVVTAAVLVAVRAGVPLPRPQRTHVRTTVGCRP